MIISRLLSIIFRFAEFVASAVVLGIISYFLHRHQKDESDSGPLGREIYTVIVAALSTLVSLLWLLPFTATFMHYPFDLLMSFAWFGAFGALVDWIHDAGCGRAFHWAGIQRGGHCNQWRAAEAFSFIAACFWFASALLSMWVYHKLGRRDPVAVDTAHRRRRWGRRSRV